MDISRVNSLNVSKLSLFIRYAALIAVCAVIFYFSAQPAVRSSQESGVIVDLIKEKIFDDFSDMTPKEAQRTEHTITLIVRKGAHFSVYAAVGFTAFLAFVKLSRPKKRYLFAVIFALIYAASDELHQVFVPGRAGMVSDVILDTCGAVTGALPLFLYVAFHNRKQRNAL